MLLQSVISTDNLQPPAQDLATFIVSRHASHFVLSRTPGAGSPEMRTLASGSRPASSIRHGRPLASV